MLEKLGTRRFVLPLVVMALVGGILAVLFYPLLAMGPRDLPFAVLSLDEGAETPQGEVNAGAAMLDMLTATSEAPDVEAPIQWNVVTSQAELDDAFEDAEYFGALVIPVDFTQQQVAFQMGEGEAPEVTLIVDKAKSPVVASQMEPAVSAIFEQQGIVVNAEVLNPGQPVASSSPLSGMMSLQLSVMPLMTMSLVGSVLITRIIPVGAVRSSAQRYKAIGRQLAYGAGLSALVSLIVMWLLNVVVAAGAAFGPMFLFLWFASFVIMTLFVGSFNLATWFGGLVGAVTILLGTMTATLPREMLPTFWADWVYPWAPQRQISAGVRDILYRDAGLVPWGTSGLLIVGAIGLTLLVIVGVFTWGRGTKPLQTVIVEEA